MGNLRAHSASKLAPQATNAKRPASLPSHGAKPGVGLTTTLIASVCRACIFLRAGAAPYHAYSESEISGLVRRDDLQDADRGLGSLSYVGIAVVLVMLGGLFSGLTIAFMSQDETYLQVIATSGEVHERKNAAQVLWLLKKGKHWVLVTLLLGNVMTNETLPVVLDRGLGGGWLAVLCSTILIVIFGEIAPQAICARYGLPIGAWLSPLVLALMWLISPVAWPTAKLLDRLLGDDQHGVLYKKAELKALVELHRSLGVDRLDEDEVTIIGAVLDLKEKPIGDIVTPIKDVYTLSSDAILDKNVTDVILSQGYSRIPIHTPNDPTNFVGMLLVKSLITYDPKDRATVKELGIRYLPETRPGTSCLDVLNYFQEGKSHMMLVSEWPGTGSGALGVVTLEDVVEELIGEEIVDESDVFVDVHRAIKRPHLGSYNSHIADMETSIAKKDSVCEGFDIEDSAALLPPKSVSRLGRIAERVVMTNGQAKIVLEARSVRMTNMMTDVTQMNIS